MDSRHEFLLRMYDQMFNDINRHIMVVWQSIGVVIGAFALLSLVEKGVVPLDVASGLIAAISFWAAINHIDSSYWYNRNLCIIANIERQFLEESDLRGIHYYWGAHRPKNRMIFHLKIQQWLVYTIATLVLAFHFEQRVLPGLGAPWSRFEVQRALPYLVTLAGIAMLVYTQRDRNESYKEFILNSPGKEVGTGGVKFGVGHGFRDGEQSPGAIEAERRGESEIGPIRDEGGPEQ